MNNKNIIFIMLDTVRADVLKPYGGDVRTANLSSIAKKGTFYEMAISPGTYTLPSHLSLFLGKRVRSIPGMKKTGMRFSDNMTDPFLKKSRYVTGEITLAKVMEYFGYKSALFSNNPFVSRPTGVADGFSHVSNIFIDKKINQNKLSVKTILHLIQNDSTRKNLIRLACGVSNVIPQHRLDKMYIGLRKKLNRHFSMEYGYYQLDKGAGETNRQLGMYLSRNANERNFLFINYMEGHEGYPTNLLTEEYVEQDKWLHMIGEAHPDDLNTTIYAYKRRLEYLDIKVGQAIKMMKKKGLLDDATVIISSDHGQAFMEHGQMFHNTHPYNEVSRVPLVVAEYESGRQINNGKIIDQPFSLTDLNRIIAGKSAGDLNKPVISDHTGITEVWDAYLLGLIRKRSKNADRIYKKKKELDRHATAIFYNNYKLIHYYGAKADELYDMNKDKSETENIISKNRGMAHMLVRYNSSIV